MTEKIQRGAILLFSAVFAAVWCWLLAFVTVSFGESKKIGLLALLLIAGTVFLVFIGKKYLPYIWKQERFWTIGSVALLVMMAVGLLYAGFSLQVYPGWDFGSVYQGAVELAEDGTFSDQSNWYFTTYPNNVAVCMFLAGVFRIFGGFCSYITLGILLNIALLLLGIVCFFLLARSMYGVRMACMGLLVCVLFIPFYMHAPIFYTDTFALPFVTGSFLMYRFRKKDMRYLILTAAILAMGYKVKGSLGVILIALLIHVWLQREKAVERMKQSMLLLVPFLLLVGFLTVLPGKMSFLDTSEADKNEFPLEHWIAMGLEGNGGYNADVYWMTASVEGKEEKKATDRIFIHEKLKEYGVSGMAEHLKKKVKFTWGDGVYFAPEKLKRDPLNESWLHSWVLYNGENYRKTSLYCNAVQILLLLGVLLSVLRNFLENGSGRDIQAMQLAVFGLFLFLLIWETRSRYLVNFVPVFILLGLDGIGGIGQSVKNCFLRKKIQDEGSA